VLLNILFGFSHSYLSVESSVEVNKYINNKNLKFTI